MKALKTIVATAVIVFALTTVAMAGVQRLDGSGAQQASAAQTVAQPATSSVTLSASQFAALLHAMDRASVGYREQAGTPSRTLKRPRLGQQNRAHAAVKTGGGAAYHASPARTTHHATGGATHRWDSGIHGAGARSGSTHGGHGGARGCD